MHNSNTEAQKCANNSYFVIGGVSQTSGKKEFKTSQFCPCQQCFTILKVRCLRLISGLMLHGDTNVLN